MADLTTTARVKQFLAIDNTTDDAIIGTLVSEASLLFEHATDRRFSESTGTLTFDACEPYVYGRKLYFRDDDVLAVTSLTDDSGAIDSDNYNLIPYNSTPKYALQLKQGYTWTYDDPEAAIVLVGTLGHNTSANIPADVSGAVTQLAAFLYQTRDKSDNTTIRFADGSTEVPANVPQRILKVIEYYKRQQAFV